MSAPPRSNSLAELLTNVRASPLLYPQSAAFRKKLADFVELQGDDHNACVYTDQTRVTFGRKKKYALVALLFNMCFYPDALDKYTMLESSCTGVGCVNPLHKRLKTQRHKRSQADVRAATVGDVTEAALRRLYPTSLDDLGETARDKKRARIKPDSS